MAMTYDIATVLARIQDGPIRYADLAGSRSYTVRQRLRPIIDQLEVEGEIRQVYIDRFPHYVAKDWELTDKLRLQIIMGRCKLVNGCAVWAGYVDPQRGPMVRLADESPKAVRRAVWEIKRGPLDYQETVRMSDSCDDACVEYRHMHLGRREDPAKGKSIPILQRRRIADTHQRARGKLDWEKVRTIRSCNDSNAQLAARYGVSKATIAQVRRQETWREFGGIFTSLLPGRAAAAGGGAHA